MRFAAEHQIVRVIAEPERDLVSPAANALILAYLSEANLREESKITYTKSLNAFFALMESERAGGSPVNFSHMTMRKYLDSMSAQQISPFTIQVRLSAIKGLACWVVDHHDPAWTRRLPGTDSPTELSRDHLDALRGIGQILLPLILWPCVALSCLHRFWYCHRKPFHAR